MKKYICIFLIIATMGSCRVFPYLYYPDAPNTTLADTKGEVKANVYFDEQSGYGLKASYAIDSHIVVFADGYNLNYSEGSPHFEFFNHFMATAGGGYYTRIGDNFHLSLLAGGSYGTTNSYVRNMIRDSIENLHIRANIFRFLGEVHFGVETKNVSVGLGVRLTDMMPSGNYLAAYSDSSNAEARIINMPLHQNSLFIDPAIMIGVGIEPIKITWEFGLSYQISGYKIPKYYGSLYFPYYTTIGVTFSLFGK